MGTVQQNIRVWDGEYDWSKAGEEWSANWGGSHAQWFGVILPRIARFVPTQGSILEIAPGYGRWTHYLRDQCARLEIVDLSESCIQACKERFAGDDRIEYHVNDGVSLGMIEDASIDFVFSFDSLVHAEADVLTGYLHEIAKKLTPDGCGFIHHSNAGEYRRYFEAIDRIPRRLLRRSIVRQAQRMGLLDKARGWRAFSVTAEQFRGSCETAGLQCISQEVITWSTTRRPIDCLSTFTTPTSRWARPIRVLVNRGFMTKEAPAIKRRAWLYSP